MGEIFRELQEESKERETRGAFERWLTEKRGTPLLLEQTQAYEAFKAGMKHYGCMTAVRMFHAEEAALAQPETAEPVIGPEWTPCVKLPITVHVREQRPGEQHISTREGITPVKPDDLIMRGVAGEEYPIGRELFEKTYCIGAHPPRDEWREASEPPEDDRSVLVWMPGKLGGLAIGRCSRGNWSPYYLGSPVTHWRDVTPPTEGER